jgi:PAS domain S-box-containing protein
MTGAAPELPLLPAAPAGAGRLDGLVAATLPLLQAVLDAVPARVLVVDRDERLAYANDGFFAFTRLHPKQVLGRHIAEIIGPATYASYAPVRERLQRGEPVRWEGWTELAGQGRRYMREHLVPVGAGEATIVMSLDLTELKLRDAELSAKVGELESTEALKSSIVDHALAALVSSDEDGHIVEFNPAAEAMFGHTRAAVIGRPVAEVIIPERFRAGHMAGMQRMRDGGPARLLGRRIELAALRADGSEFPIEMVLWRTGAAGRAFFTASLFDLTERHAAQQEIGRQRDALRQSEKLTAMGSLLAGVAHELNNPLSIVMGRATLLEAKCDPYPPLRDDATRIREAAERCARIVRTFLNMARQRPVERRNVQLNDLVRGAVDLLQYGLRSGGLHTELLLADGLPEVLADGDQLGQVVLNLLVNAQQALAGGQGRHRLRIETGVEAPRAGRSPRVWLRVADNGRGVDAEHRARIFDPFFTTKREGVGTGLGLSVSRSVAREHGGELALEETSPLGGASFRLSVPLSPEPPASAPAPLPADDEAPSSRVLVVDDEPEVAALLREVLEGAGYEVASAESGAVALELLREARFDAIVSDLRMPDTDGAGLWRRVRADHPALAQRMLFVTGDTLSPAASEFLRETGCDFLEKPFTPAEVLARVKALLPGPT